MAPRKPKDILNGSKAVVVDRIAGILRTGDPTKFALMAACRHGLRQAFIECGHSWALTDWAAERVVLGALNQVGARWPRWIEGQPEYTQDGFTPTERTRCTRCGGALPEGHRLYCSPVCARSAHNWRWAKDRRAELAAYQRAYRAAQRAKQARHGY